MITSWEGLLIHPHFVVFGRAIVGLILLKAGITKLFSLREFSEMIVAYKLLPEVTAQVLGRILPGVEVVLGGMLLIGILLPWSAIGAAILFLVFGGAITINLLRGHRNISCGCLGSHVQHLRWSMVVQNGFFVILALMSMAWPISLRWAKSPHSVSDTTKQLPLEETLVTVLIGGTVLAILSLWEFIATALLNLSDFGESHGGRLSQRTVKSQRER